TALLILYCSASRTRSWLRNGEFGGYSGTTIPPCTIGCGAYGASFVGPGLGTSNAAKDDAETASVRSWQTALNVMRHHKAATGRWHQSWLGSVFRVLDAHIREQNLGKLFVSPVDVVLNPENTVQPDLVFISTTNLRIVQRRAIFGAPDLLVELISPSSVRRDRY